MARPPSNLGLRLLTALVGVPAILSLLYFGPPWGFYALVFVASMIGSAELFAMTHAGDRASQAIGVLLSAGASFAVYACTHDPRVIMTALIVLPVLGPLITLVRVGDIATAAMRSFAMSTGPLYVAVSLALLAVMRRDLGSDGPGYCVLCFMLAWFADTGGYFAGRFLGKRKLYPAVSPKKTVEGALGGLAGAVIGALSASLGYLRSLPVSHAIALALVAGALGQAGDLGESLIKRSTGVKDSGAIVPGHGGILDRVDALIVTSVVVFLYTLWIRS